MAELNYMQRARTNGYRSLLRRNSLIDDARVDRRQHDSQRRDSIEGHRCKLIAEEAKQTAAAEALVKQLNDEGVELIWSAGDLASMRYAVVFGITGDDNTRFLADVLATIRTCSIKLTHIETRIPKSTAGNVVFEVLITCESSKADFLNASETLQKLPQLKSIKLYPELLKVEVPWFPECVWELDKCCHVVTKYEPELDSRHPGHGDAEYVRRRTQIARLAADYKHGATIPRIDYTEAEQRTWREVYLKLKTLYPSAACKEFLAGFKLLEDEGYLSPDFVPQLEDLSNDVIHELLGHCPMFTDPVFAQFSQEIGLLSLGASDAEIEKLATVYWFIIEFGLCKENNQMKACGAGLLSAFGELQHALSDVPQHAPFEPEKTALLAYEDNDYQPLYVVADSIQDAMQKLRHYAKSIQRPFQLIYDPYTETVRRIADADDLLHSVDRIRSDLSQICAVMTTLVAASSTSATGSGNKASGD